MVSELSLSLSVVIATGGRAELLERSLRSLHVCEKPDGYAGVVICENGNDAQPCREVVAKMPPELRCVYRYEPKGNKSYALNSALEEVKSELLYFTDDDVRFSSETLMRYVAAAERHGPRNFFGGPVSVDYEQAPFEWVTGYLPASARGWRLDKNAAERVFLRPDFLGFNWAAFRSDVEAIGGFDPSFGPGSASGATGQETDAMQRLLDSGVSGRYVEGAEVWHYVPRERCTPEWVLKRYYQAGLSVGMKSRVSRLQTISMEAKLAIRRIAAAVSPVRRRQLRFGHQAMSAWCRGWNDAHAREDA